jgi:hypothetical protein
MRFDEPLADQPGIPYALPPNAGWIHCYRIDIFHVSVNLSQPGKFVYSPMTD